MDNSSKETTLLVEYKNRDSFMHVGVQETLPFTDIKIWFKAEFQQQKKFVGSELLKCLFCY